MREVWNQDDRQRAIKAAPGSLHLRIRRLHEECTGDRETA